MIVGGWRHATIAHAAPAAEHARILHLDVPGWPGNLPGQHLDLRVTADDGYQAVRSYSLASSGAGERIELAVDEIMEGEVSPYLVEDVLPGDEMEVMGPLGQFFVWRESDPSPVQLIAGGSGIVPLIAMARSRAASASTAPFRLLYSVRSPERAMYRDEIDRLGASTLDLTWIYTRSAPDGWGGPVGRVQPATLDAAVWPVTDNPLVFICGPTPFVEVVAQRLLDRGYPHDRIRTERFGG